MPENTKPAGVTDLDITTNKTLRRDLDGALQTLKGLAPSRERALARTKIEEAVMWLGMDLKRIGEARPEVVPNPYPNSKDPSNTVVDKTADGLRL
jgi:hypothetical protein